MLHLRWLPMGTALLCLLSSACSGSQADEFSAELDATTEADAAEGDVLDASPGSNMDAGRDAGSDQPRLDAGHEGGVTHDASVSEAGTDAGTELDAASDAGSAEDAGNADASALSDAAAGDGGKPSLATIADPAPLYDTPGQYTLGDQCPSANTSIYTLDAGSKTSTTLSGNVMNAVGNGTFYVQGPSGGVIAGTVPTANGAYTVNVPLFCGAQTVKLLWTSASGCQLVLVEQITTSNCVEPDIRITLTWDDHGRDFELHLIEQGGRINDNATDCTWTSCISASPDWGVVGDPSDNPHKDVDNTGFFGPENITLSKPTAQTYTVMVEHWNSSGLPDADGQVIINLRDFGTTVVNITDLAFGHVFTAATITFPSGVVTPVASYYDCTGSWSSGCKAAIP